MTHKPEPSSSKPTITAEQFLDEQIRLTGQDKKRHIEWPDAFMFAEAYADFKGAALRGEIVRLKEKLNELAEELHAAINEPMYSGTRKDWIARCMAAEAKVETLTDEINEQNSNQEGRK